MFTNKMRMGDGAPRRVVDAELVAGAGAQAGNDGAAGGAGGDGDVVRFRATLAKGTALILVVGQGAPQYQPYQGTWTPGGPAGGYTTGKGANHVGGQGGRSGQNGSSGVGGGGGQASAIWINNAVWGESGGGGGGGGGSNGQAGTAGNTGGVGGAAPFGTSKGEDAVIDNGFESTPVDGGGGGGGGGSSTNAGSGGRYGLDSSRPAFGGNRGTSTTPSGATTFGASANNGGAGIGGSGYVGAGPSSAVGGQNGRITLWVDGVKYQFDYTGSDQSFVIP